MNSYRIRKSKRKIGVIREWMNRGMMNDERQKLQITNHKLQIPKRSGALRTNKRLGRNHVQTVPVSRVSLFEQMI